MIVRIVRLPYAPPGRRLVKFGYFAARGWVVQRSTQQLSRGRGHADCSGVAACPAVCECRWFSLHGRHERQPRWTWVGHVRCAVWVGA